MSHVDLACDHNEPTVGFVALGKEKGRRSKPNASATNPPQCEKESHAK